MKFNKFNYGFSLLLLACTLMLVTSCKDDEVDIPDVEGINVQDGMYLAVADTDPVASAILRSEVVEDDAFGSQSRTGFVANYIYLTAGNYNMVEVTSKEITATYGGTAVTELAEEQNCTTNEYTLVTITENGAAFAVSEGLYKVTYDQLTGEMVIFKADMPSIIGNSPEGSDWGDIFLPGSVDATGGSWQITEQVFREGEWKIRFNCHWNIDRRIDPNAGFEEDNAYMLFTNFGGSTDNLQAGAPNIPLAAADEGIYTVDINWSPDDGWTVALTRTGDAPVITFDPANHQWGIIGDATPTGWDSDTDFDYIGESGGTYTWELASIDLTAGGNFKLRTNDLWTEELNWETINMTGDVSDFTNDGTNTNIIVNTDATYKITLTTSDEGDNYMTTFEQL